MPKQKGKSNILGSIIFLFFVLIVALGVYYYFFRTLQATGEEISTLINQGQTLKSQESSLTALRSIFSESSDQSNELESRIVQQNGAIDFINTIENLASFAHLSHQTVAVDTQDTNPASDHYELLHLNFQTEGTWQNTFYFISLLETLPFNINITQLNIHFTGDTTTDNSGTPPIDLTATTSSSTTVKPSPKKASVWDATYDFTVLKLR